MQSLSSANALPSALQRNSFAPSHFASPATHAAQLPVPRPAAHSALLVHVAIVVATPHRAEAFQAYRYAIERVKQVAPIWKHEFFEDGDMWVEGAPADPEDEAARQRALERACA